MIYTRVSSREQQQEGFSLYAQCKLLQEYAERNELRIVRAFEDVETAKVTGRKQLQEMVRYFRRNRSCRVLLVEKTDRLYRNFRDAVMVEDLDVAVHFVKEGQIISKDSKSQAVLIYGFNLVLARHYSHNLREEVKKGMREKAAQGIYPGHAPFGYRNNKAERTIEVDPVASPVVERIFALYATGSHSLSTLAKAIWSQTGKRISRNNLHLILKNPFYLGFFQWSGQTYTGTHALFLDPVLFERVQSILDGHNRPEYSKREVAFRGLMRCAYCGCMVTGDVQKERYVYYRCTGNHGKCDLPRFREEDIAERLGQPLKCLEMPQELASQIISTVRMDRRSAAGKIKAERVQRTLELANRAHSLYVSQSSMEKASLLKMLFSSCFVDAVSVIPTYRRPFDMIVRRVNLEEWLYYLASEVSTDEPTTLQETRQAADRDLRTEDAEGRRV